TGTIHSWIQYGRAGRHLTGKQCVCQTGNGGLKREGTHPCAAPKVNRAARRAAQISDPVGPPLLRGPSFRSPHPSGERNFILVRTPFTLSRASRIGLEFGPCGSTGPTGSG